ncbi:16S rRNA (guanine(527)-N(7))-methyltransferase RsmG [Novosphingobium sp. Gsoil 351]|uniref:16S rRNA (guanine(527)-N(7))-methyltransferase RsmG n=1 Tax=Novosphingobium sp. Gsoil 351 TaxID=2675225 RepID=UPI0012B4E507|nr:16S rRNA (guanine(527)-N(7))-methyltransferase RsmG [Novosphingobium sp. Gsoil 351]QGN54893.1 16S rRNA (guanine(527)-N(7))-methyltransferase RsmG [Novosphingobium sp. Gsoil 351]
MTLASEGEARDWFGSVLGCDAATLARLDRLVELLRAENMLQNLVSDTSLAQVWVRHLADSAQLIHVSRETSRGTWLDLGSGAGFPGLVVALCRPAGEVILVESRNRRIAWLESAIDRLSITNARVFGGKLEAMETIPAATISARAFAPLARLIALSARFSTSQTQWLLPKGRKGRQELLEMPNTVKSMFHVEQSLTDPDSVILVGRGVPPDFKGKRT